MVGWTFQNNIAERVVRKLDMSFSTWSARCTFGETLDSQTLTTLLASPGCATLGVDALLDTIPVWFRDAKFMEQVTCRHTQKKDFITYLTISMISKSSLQMFLSYYINRMEQQTLSQLQHSSQDWGVFFFWGNILLHINFSLSQPRDYASQWSKCGCNYLLSESVSMNTLNNLTTWLRITIKCKSTNTATEEQRDKLNRHLHCTWIWQDGRTV